MTTPSAISAVEKHRRQIELSPGVGVEVQQYALAVCDDILADLRAIPSASSSAPARMLGVVHSCKECPKCTYDTGGVYQCDLTGAKFYSGRPLRIDSACPLPPVSNTAQSSSTGPHNTACTIDEAEAWVVRYRAKHGYTPAIVQAYMAGAERGTPSTGREWLPIATAPKGEDVILTNGMKVSQGGWIDEKESGMIGWWSVDGGGWEPTHWMRLPSPTSSAIVERKK